MSHHDYKSAEERIDSIDRKHQAQYLASARECDKRTIELIRSFSTKLGRPARILDIGSGFGNFLHHCRSAIPDGIFTGAEYSKRLLEIMKDEPHVTGMNFVECDITKAPPPGEYDAIASTAVFYQFDAAEYQAALRNVASCLVPGGVFVCYEFFTHFPHSLEIRERSLQYNENKGIPLHIRNVGETTNQCLAAGFSSCEITPFHIGIDLERGQSHGEQSATDAYTDDLKTFTISDKNGDRLMFRGAIFEPWGHLKAVKAA